jgi:hypothetical protein
MYFNVHHDIQTLTAKIYKDMQFHNVGYGVTTFSTYLQMNWQCNLCLHKQTTHIIQVFFYLPTAAQVNCLKNNFKIYVKTIIKTASTCFGVFTPSSGSALLVLAKVTVVKVAN